MWRGAFSVTLNRLMFGPRDGRKRRWLIRLRINIGTDWGSIEREMGVGLQRTPSGTSMRPPMDRSIVAWSRLFCAVRPGLLLPRSAQRRRFLDVAL